jgi:hypothetical protein
MPDSQSSPGTILQQHIALGRPIRPGTRAPMRARCANSIPVKLISFTDPRVQGVSPFAGHDNYLHLHFKI